MKYIKPFFFLNILDFDLLFHRVMLTSYVGPPVVRYAGTFKCMVLIITSSSKISSSSNFWPAV